jgi:protein SCO1/2
MKLMKWSPGQEFEMVIVSMDHTENAELAAAKKQNYLKAYGRPQSADGWHFLTGSKENVKALADQLGFKFNWLPDKKQFAHAAVAYVVTPQGKISRYLHGIQPELNTLKLSLLEASNGTIGTAFEQAMMFCFKFDPTKNKYTLAAWNVMRIGAIFMVLMLAVFLLPVWWREQRR